MKEFLTLVKRFDMKGLFLSPSNNIIIQAFRYLFVGGFAFLVDNGSYALMLWLIGEQYYLLFTVVSFILGLVTNFALSKWLVFSKEDARVNPVMEFLGYALIGVIGLGITAVLVWLGTWLFATGAGNTVLPLTAWSWNNNPDVVGWQAFVSKIIAAVIVLAWNFVARKFFLYKRRATQ